MKATELLFEFYDYEDDNYMKAELSDTRRPRLSLRHLHKLRCMRDVQALSKKEHSEFVKTMYNASSGDTSEF